MKIIEISNDFDLSTQRGRLEYYLNQPIEGNVAIHLNGLGKFFKNDSDPLAILVPERNGLFALHPDKWESTFYSLTNKDLKKISNYNPSIIDIPSNGIVADMTIANKFYRTDDKNEQVKLADDYIKSINSNINTIKMPEVIIPNTIE